MSVVDFCPRLFQVRYGPVICPGIMALSLILLGLCLARLRVLEFLAADVIFIKCYVWIIRVLIQM